MYSQDAVSKFKENARWYRKFNNEERFLDFANLLRIMEDAVEKDRNLQSRQLNWIDSEKNKIRSAIRKLRGLSA